MDFTGMLWRFTKGSVAGDQAFTKNSKKRWNVHVYSIIEKDH